MVPLDTRQEKSMNESLDPNTLALTLRHIGFGQFDAAGAWIGWKAKQLASAFGAFEISTDDLENPAHKALYLCACREWISQSAYVSHLVGRDLLMDCNPSATPRGFFMAELHDALSKARAHGCSTEYTPHEKLPPFRHLALSWARWLDDINGEPPSTSSPPVVQALAELEAIELSACSRHGFCMDSPQSRRL